MFTSELDKKKIRYLKFVRKQSKFIAIMKDGKIKSLRTKVALQLLVTSNIKAVDDEREYDGETIYGILSRGYKAVLTRLKALSTK